jgi:hypothetical protein
METELKSNQDLPASSSHRPPQLIDPRHAVRNGLLEQKVAPGLCRRNRDLQVERRRVAHDHGLRPLLKRPREIRFYRQAGEILGREGALAGSVQDDVELPKAPQVAEMAAADRSQAGDEESHV